MNELQGTAVIGLPAGIWMALVFCAVRLQIIIELLSQ